MDGLQEKAQENDDGADVLPVVEGEEGGRDLANEEKDFQEGAEAPETSPKAAPAPVNAATGLVGALDHVLKKTFKDFYDVEEELPMHSPEQGMGKSQEDIDESPDEDDNVHEAESELSDNVDNEENNTTGESLDQRSLQPEGEDFSDAGDAATSVEDQQPDESANVDRQSTILLAEQNCCVKDVLGFDGGAPAEEGLQVEIGVIEGDLRDELDQAKQLELFLEAERGRAAAADQEVADEVYSKGLLVGAEFPLGPSNYAIDAQKLREFGEMSAHLINVNRLLDANEENELYKRGQVTRGEDKACEMRPSTPNYLLPKERSKAKALMAAKAKYKARGTDDPRAREQANGNQESFENVNEDERSELSPEEAERFQRQEEAEKRRRELLSKAPQMTSETMQANMELLARMKKQIAFLKNPRFTLTTRATRDWRASLLNKDLSEPPTFAADEVKQLEESWDVGFLDESSVLQTNKASTANADACGLAHIADIKAEGSKLKENLHGSPELSFSFNVDPGFAFFTDYEVNEPQECLLKIVNVACVSRGLRFLPPTSKYFSIADAEFPSTASVVAPGMSCHLRIAFCADSLADYRDFVTVCTETERFRIALVARRTPPRLSLSRDLNAGSCFLGTRLSRTFPFSNQGGPARFRLVSEGEWAAKGMHANADEDTGNDLQLQGGVFTVLPKQFDLVTGQETALHVRFTPQTVGSMSATFLIVCDNCQVQLVTVRAASCQVKIEISRVGDRQLDISRKALLPPPRALDFGSITSGGTTHNSISYLNPTPIALNFHWTIRDVRARASEDFAIEPKAGTLEPGAEQNFTLRFSPVGTRRAACIHRALAQLVIDNIPPCAVDGASSRQLKRSSTKRGASASDDGLRSVPCSRLTLTGGSKPASVSFAPSAQIKLRRPLLADQQGEVSTTIHNTSDCVVSISWSNLDVGDHGRTTFTPIPSHVQLAPNEKTKVRFAFVPRSAGVLCHSLCCNLNGRPSTHWLCINADVIGPSVVLEAREVDFGLIGVGKSSEITFVIRNTSTSSSAQVSLQEVTQDSTDAKEDTARITITNGSTFSLAPQEARTVSVICEASYTPERMRKCWSVRVQHSSTLFINLRAEIQSPKVFLQVSEDNHQCKLEFGTTYVTVPVSRTVRLVNLSNLAAPFRWVEPSCDDGTSADEKAADERATSRAYDVRFSCREGTLKPKESRDIVVTFEGIKPGRVVSLFACEVEGMPVPLGFSLHSLVRGLVVAYSLVGPEVSAVDMAPGRPPTLEGALGGTATSKGSSASGSGAAATASGTSGSSASNTGVPALDFGSDLELCKRKRLRLCIANHSAITTKYEVLTKAFAAKTVPRSLTTPDDENNSPTSPGKSSKSISHAGQTVAKLGSAHEEWSVYASKSGRKYIEAKVQAFEDREVLSAGRGVAFLALPKTGMLRPWQAVIIDVYCFNNMPGRYRSELHCLVDGLNPSVAPIKASVQGSPLCLASNTVGLVKRQGESRLHFGHPLVGTEPVYKVIKVSNNGPVAAKVSWRVVAKRGPKADLLETSIAFDEHKMAEDIDARVHVKLRPHADLSKAPPFVVEPHTLQIRPYASGSFRVTFFPDSAEEAEDAAIMIADADWVDEAHLKSVDDDGAAVSILTLDNLATELLASSIGTVQGAEHCNGERTASRDSRASRNMSPPAGAATRAPLRDFERIHLGAHSAKPCLELDRAKRGPQGRAFLGFVAWSTRARDHGSFFKTLTFTNSTATHTCCVVRTEPPFVLDELRTTSASTAALPGRELAQLREVVPPEVLAQGQEAGLPPGATLALTLRFQPAELVNKLAHDPNNVLRTTYPGALDIYFHNGEHQGIDLEGTVVSPAVLLAPAVFDFGHVHVETTTRTVLYMTNPTVVPASWRVSHVPKKARAGISSPNNPETIDDPSCWSFDIESGVLAGPTLPLSSAQGCMPKGFDSKGKRVPLAISLCFSPSRQGFHETKFRFAVDAGLDFDIVVRGTGSYEEFHDTSVRPLPAPSF